MFFTFITANVLFRVDPGASPASRMHSALALAVDVPVRRALFGAPDPTADDVWDLPPQRAWNEHVEDGDGDEDAHVIALFRRLRGALSCLFLSLFCGS